MSKIELDPIASGHNLAAINNNFQKIEDEFNQKVLYRDNPGGNPNQMLNNLDMNGKNILNVGSITGGGGSPSLSADNITFTPSSGVTSTNVQDAIEEVQNNITSLPVGVSSYNGRTGSVVGIASDVTSALGYTPVNSASASFTGTVTVPTRPLGDNTTAAASTEFVKSNSVASFNSRTGVVVLTKADVTSAVGFPITRGPDQTNVLDFGAVGNGTTDSTVAFQNAIASAKASSHKTLYIPSGSYLINSSIDCTGLSLYGDHRKFGDDNSSLVKTNSNIYLFTFTNGRGSVNNLSFVGSNNSAHTTQAALKIDTCNDIRVSDCDFYYFHTSINQIGECFYGRYSNLRFYDHRYAGFDGVGNTNPGFDIHFNDCLMTSVTGSYGFKFTQAGSVTMDSVVITPSGMTGASVFFDSDASLAGVHQISNCVFESAPYGLYLKGTSSQRVKFVMVSNTYIAGFGPTTGNNIALRVDYGHATFSTCYFTSDNYGARIFNDGYLHFSDCDWQVLNVPVTAESTASSVQLSFTNMAYDGGYPFISMSTLPTPSVLKRIDILGGAIGVASSPVDIPTDTPGVRIAKGLVGSSGSSVTSFNTRTGAVSLTGNDVSNAVSTSTALITTPVSLRSTGTTLPSSGSGVEISYSGGSGYVTSYNRTANAYTPLNLDGSAVTFKSGAASVDQNGYLLVGYAGTQGPYKLQVNGDVLVSNALFTQTPSVATTGTRVATCDYVIAKLAAGTSGVTSFNSRAGVVTLTNTDVTSALGYTPATTGANVFTGKQQVNNTVHVTGETTPSSGVGIEISYSSGSNSGYVVAYNRNTSAYIPLNLDGSAISFKSGAAAVDQNGSMLIGYGGTNGSTYKLQVNSQIYATSATIATSDVRVKKNIKPLVSGLAEVLKLQPVTYEFRKHDIHNFPKGNQVGFIAQDVETVLVDTKYLESVVATNDDGKENLKGLAEVKLVPLLVKAIQELEARLKALETKDA